MSYEKCSETISHSKIKLTDPGETRKAVFLNLDRTEYTRTRVDGCLLVQTLAADWVISKAGVADVIVELKGGDVDHAVTQIEATALYWQSAKLSNGRLAALVVCRQYPRFDTKIQRAAAKLAKNFKAPLHVVTGNREFNFECVLSFKGPFAS